MKTNCNYPLIGGGKFATSKLLATFVSLLLVTTACTQQETIDPMTPVPLKVKVDGTDMNVRSLVTGTTLTAGSIGVTLVDGNENDYNAGGYANLQYTYSGSAWNAATGVTVPQLTGTAGKAVAYYPFHEDHDDYTAIPIVAADQQDVLYSEWATGLSNTAATTTFQMKHALAAVRVIFKKHASYTADATAINVSVTSDAIHGIATLNAATGALAVSSPGATVSMDGSWAVTSAGTTADLVVIPGTSAANLTFTATIGDKEYTATTENAVTLTRGYIHTFTLTLTKTDLTVGSVVLDEWKPGVSDNLTLEQKPTDVVGTIDLTTAPNGVYAVAKNGLGVTVDKADESCVAVALIVNDADVPQRIMIEKNETKNTTSIQAAYDADGATNTDYQKFYWGPDGVNVNGNTDWINGDGYSVPADYKTWYIAPTYAWNDYSGIVNTAVLMNITDNDSFSTYANAATWCKKFNETMTENQGFTDWYIPACGQLALIYINRTDVNTLLTKIGGVLIDTNSIYWCSTEYYSLYNGGWYLNFKNGQIDWNTRYSLRQVRFIRDIISYITFTIDDVKYIAEEGMTWSEWVGSDYNTIGLQVLNNEYIGQYIATQSGKYVLEIEESENEDFIELADEVIIDNWQYCTGHFPI